MEKTCKHLFKTNVSSDLASQQPARRNRAKDFSKLLIEFLVRQTDDRQVQADD